MTLHRHIRWIRDKTPMRTIALKVAGRNQWMRAIVVGDFVRPSAWHSTLPQQLHSDGHFR